MDLRAGHPVADRGHDADAFVPGDKRDRRRDWPVTIRGMDVGVAQAGCLHAHDDLARAGLGYRPVLDYQWLAETRYYCCSHDSPPLRFTRALRPAIRRCAAVTGRR